MSIRVPANDEVGAVPLREFLKRSVASNPPSPFQFAIGSRKELEESFWRYERVFIVVSGEGRKIPRRPSTTEWTGRSFEQRGAVSSLPDQVQLPGNHVVTMDRVH